MLTTMRPITHAKGQVWVWGTCENCHQEKVVQVMQHDRLCEGCQRAIFDKLRESGKNDTIFLDTNKKCG